MYIRRLREKSMTRYVEFRWVQTITNFEFRIELWKTQLRDGNLRLAKDNVSVVG